MSAQAEACGYRSGWSRGHFPQGQFERFHEAAVLLHGADGDANVLRVFEDLASAHYHSAPQQSTKDFAAVSADADQNEIGLGG